MTDGDGRSGRAKAASTPLRMTGARAGRPARAPANAVSPSTQARAKVKTGPLPTKRAAHRPSFQPTDKDRATVRVMVAGDIEQTAICSVIGVTPKTLRRHFRHEIDTGAAEANAAVVASLHRMAVGSKASEGRPAVLPDVRAAIWWTKARLGWQEGTAMTENKLADTPMRVIIELVGDPAPVQVEQVKQPRLGYNPGGHVQLVG